MVTLGVVEWGGGIFCLNANPLNFPSERPFYPGCMQKTRQKSLMFTNRHLLTRVLIADRSGKIDFLCRVSLDSPTDGEKSLNILMEPWMSLGRYSGRVQMGGAYKAGRITCPLCPGNTLGSNRNLGRATLHNLLPPQLREQENEWMDGNLFLYLCEISS